MAAGFILILRVFLFIHDILHQPPSAFTGYSIIPKRCEAEGEGERNLTSHLIF